MMDHILRHRMRRTLAVTEAVNDIGLLTTDELREAAAVTDNSQDAVLAVQNRLAASALASECKIAAAAGGQPTFLRETLTETFYGWPHRSDLDLSRRHKVVIDSVTIDDKDIDASDYTVDGENGLLSRLNGLFWMGQKIVVVYRAGFLFAADTAEPDVEAIPDELRYAAILTVQQVRSLAPPTGRDMNLQRTQVEGVGSVQYQVDSPAVLAARPIVVDAAKALLGRFTNVVFG